MPSPAQSVILADFTHYLNKGLRKYFSDHQYNLKPLYAEALKEVGILLREHGALPVILTDTFVMDRNPTCIMKIKSAVPDAKIIILAEKFMPCLRQLPGMGADALVSKCATFAELKSIILNVSAATEVLLCSVFKTLFAAGSDTIRTAKHVLGERDLELIIMSLEFKNDKEIGEKLHIEPNTVAKYRKKILDTLTLQWGYSSAIEYVERNKLLMGRF